MWDHNGQSFKYVLEGGKYVWHGYDGEKLFESDSLAVGFTKDPETGELLLHKHGQPEWVKKWAEKFRKKQRELRDAGHDEMAYILGECCVIEGKFPVDAINRLISTVGYLEVFIQEQQITV